MLHRILSTVFGLTLAFAFNVGSAQAQLPVHSTTDPRANVPRPKSKTIPGVPINFRSRLKVSRLPLSNSTLDPKPWWVQPKIGETAIGQKFGHQVNLSPPSAPTMTEDMGAVSPSTIFYWPYYNAALRYSIGSESITVANPSSSEQAVVAANLYETNGQIQTYSTSVSPLSDAVINFQQSGFLSLSANIAVFAIDRAIVGYSVYDSAGLTAASNFFYWPYYDSAHSVNQNSDIIAIANPPTNSQSATVSLSVGTYTWAPASPVSPGNSLYAVIPDISTGMVTLKSNVPVVASQIYLSSIYQNTETLTQVPGISQASKNLWWPVYNSVITKNQDSDLIIIANPFYNGASALVNVSAGAFSWQSNLIPPGGYQIMNICCFNPENPIVLTSNVGVIATQKSTVGSTISETPGNPSLSAGYWWPIYDSTVTPNQDEDYIVVANPNLNVADVTAYIGSQLVASTSVAPDSVSYTSLTSTVGGPLVLSSSQNIVASQLIIAGPNAPKVNSIDPNVGANIGGTQVTVTGTGFVYPISVNFGSVPSNNVTVINSTTLTAIAPPQSAGIVSVTVNTLSGGSPPVITGLFTYVNATVKFPQGSTGYDISWPQCPWSQPSVAAGTISVIGSDFGHPFSTNPCLSNEVSWAGANNNFYAVIFYETSDTQYSQSPLNCTGSNATDACFAYNYGYNAAAWIFNNTTQAGYTSGIWWLDIEGAPGSSMPLWSTDLNANAQAIQGAIDFFSSQNIPGTQNKEQVGIYASPCVWPEIVGGQDTASGCTGYSGYSPGVPEWIADYNNPANPSQYCSSSYNFTGGATWMVQYTDNNNGLDGDYSC
jgi:hypothetical protein